MRSNRPHFLTDFFLSNFVTGRASQSNLHTYSYWWCCPQCSVFYRVKGHILVHILVCALQASMHFLTDFFQILSWRCILVKSTRLLVIGGCCPQCSVFYRVNGHILVEILVCALTGHISWWISFKICHRCASWSNSTHLFVFGWCCPQCSVFYRVKGHILVEMLCALCRPHFLTDFFQIFHSRWCAS